MYYKHPVSTVLVYNSYWYGWLVGEFYDPICISQDEGEDNEGVEAEGASTKDIDPNNPREYIQKTSATMDDEYSTKKGTMQNYYGIAHTLREPVDSQPTIVINGRLKEYQVRGCHCYSIAYSLRIGDTSNSMLLLSSFLPMASKLVCTELSVCAMNIGYSSFKIKGY